MHRRTLIVFIFLGLLAFSAFGKADRRRREKGAAKKKGGEHHHPKKASELEEWGWNTNSVDETANMSDITLDSHRAGFSDFTLSTHGTDGFSAETLLT
mmetsp:Transcript_104575/g.145746  ORF Transcript_104575/g.145746 Transcript_104575/m.145746 type:complete len:98 (+) Transcript_104575:28-321(+)